MIDDAHNADKGTLKALAQAVTEQGAPLWVCLLGRPKLERTGTIRLPARHVRIELEPLADEEARTLCRALPHM